MQRDRTLFISYRRADSSGWAGRLQADLRSRLGTDVQVFMDVDAIPAGEDFVRAIEDAVSRSHALVALIGPGWVTAQDAQGRRRLDDPNDLVRIEIEAALRRGIRVIPTLVGGASLPSPDVLPETLRALTRRQALRLDNETWNLGLSRLARAIEHPRRAPLTWFTRLRLQPGRKVVIVGLLLAMAATIWLTERLQDQDTSPSPGIVDPECKEENSPGPDNKRDYRGRTFSHTYCVRTSEYGFTQIEGKRAGRLYAGVNWMACQERFPNNPIVGTSTSDWWLWTQGDDEGPDRWNKDAWGWFPATYVSGARNEEPIPNVPPCNNRVDDRP